MTKKTDANSPALDNKDKKQTLPSELRERSRRYPQNKDEKNVNLN